MKDSIGTVITKGGQTTIPAAVRSMLGVGAHDHVYWTCEEDRVYVSAAPAVPLSITSARDFWDRIGEAEVDVASGRMHDATELSQELRGR